MQMLCKAYMLACTSIFLAHAMEKERPLTLEEKVLQFELKIASLEKKVKKYKALNRQQKEEIRTLKGALPQQKSDEKKQKARKLPTAEELKREDPANLWKEGVKYQIVEPLTARLYFEEAFKRNDTGIKNVVAYELGRLILKHESSVNRSAAIEPLEYVFLNTQDEEKKLEMLILLCECYIHYNHFGPQALKEMVSYANQLCAGSDARNKARAEYVLGSLYCVGYGMAHDLDSARVYLERVVASAADQNLVKTAVRKLRKIEKGLFSPEKVASIRKRPIKKAEPDESGEDEVSKS